ncbi:patatin-like phospholipase family protein [Ereboglobus luteus]|nr:patatin-like phospholipase family protein [Ereboglobus luteus]
MSRPGHILQVLILRVRLACRAAVWVTSFAIAFLFSGCAHAPLNQPLEKNAPRAESLRMPAENTTDLAVFLFFSGGGKRASALSYGVLKALSDTTVLLDGHTHRLSDRVEFISSVSGGSFTAAYYGLYGDRIFEDFEKRYLKHNTDAALSLRLLNPYWWFRLGSGYYGRSDMAARYYDKRLFKGATFGDLLKNGNRPFLSINATDAANAEQFSFTQTTFDLISSDLSRYPISRAVAASSAVPFALTPVTLKNYSNKTGVQSYVDPLLLPARKADPMRPLTEREQYLRKIVRSYTDEGERPFIHLVDGGMSDNLGLHGIIDASVMLGGLHELMDHVRMKPPEKLLFVIVNAEARRGGHLTETERTPGSFETMRQVNDIRGNQRNARTLEALMHLVEEWKDRNRPLAVAGQPAPEFYIVIVDFEKLADDKEREFFQTLPTRFSLPDKTIDLLTAAGGKILRDSPEFQRLLRDIAGDAAQPAGNNRAE